MRPKLSHRRLLKVCIHFYFFFAILVFFLSIQFSLSISAISTLSGLVWTIFSSALNPFKHKGQSLGGRDAIAGVQCAIADYYPLMTL